MISLQCPGLLVIGLQFVTLVKANYKRLKIALASGVRKLSLASVASKLGKFSLFDNFFDFSPMDLNDFWNLANFLLFNFLDFLACFTLLPPNPQTSLLLSFFQKAGLLLLFLLEADLLPSFLLEAGLFGDLVVFNIEISRVAIPLKPWMNRQ